MAQRTRAVAAVLERRLCHHHDWFHPGLAARHRFVADRYLVRQRLAGGGALVLPDGGVALHPGAAVAYLVIGRAGVVCLAAVACWAAVVEGDADGQLVAGGAVDAQGQLAVAAAWQVAECRRGAVALCVAGSWVVLCGQGDHCDHTGYAD
ncbi:hypothetical protein D3C79_844220 [compost metagenome]